MTGELKHFPDGIEDQESHKEEKDIEHWIWISFKGSS